MKNFKKYLVVTTAFVSLAGFTAVFAATPSDIVSNLTGKTSEQLLEERASGKTYGAIAREFGKIDEFKSEMLKEKKLVLDQRVSDNILTEEASNEIYNTMKENQENCDGTNSSSIGKSLNAKFGNGISNGQGQNKGNRKGQKLRNGSEQGKFSKELGNVGQGNGFRFNR